MNKQKTSADRLPEELSVWRAIIASLWSMKRWVQVWLFFLHGLFLAAIFFLPDPSAKWILIGYVASGPLLLVFMVAQRGLTRLLGIAHLIPWVPLIIYLVVRLTTDLAGPRLTASAQPLYFAYLVVFAVALGICLVLDVFDAIRWFRGERYVLGSKRAAEVDASRRVTID